MLHCMFCFFPFQSMLIEYAGFFFVPLTSRLVNDDSAACRKLTALAIKSLLAKVSQWIWESRAMVIVLNNAIRYL